MYKDEIIVMVSEKFWSSLDQVKHTHTEITFEQFKKYVLDLNETTVMKTFPITRSQFQSLHNIACSAWKAKITTMAQEKLGAFGASCELDYETVESMFKAATSEQLPIVKKVFPDFNTDKNIDLKSRSSEELFTNNSLSTAMIEIRNGGQHEGKAFFLSESQYNWKLERDECDDLVLVPTLK